MRLSATQSLGVRDDLLAQGVGEQAQRGDRRAEIVRDRGQQCAAGLLLGGQAPGHRGRRAGPPRPARRRRGRPRARRAPRGPRRPGRRGSPPRRAARRAPAPVAATATTPENTATTASSSASCPLRNMRPANAAAIDQRLGDGDAAANRRKPPSDPPRPRRASRKPAGGERGQPHGQEDGGGLEAGLRRVRHRHQRTGPGGRGDHDLQPGGGPHGSNP